MVFDMAAAARPVNSIEWPDPYDSSGVAANTFTKRWHTREESLSAELSHRCDGRGSMRGNRLSRIDDLRLPNGILWREAVRVSCLSSAQYTLLSAFGRHDSPAGLLSHTAGGLLMRVVMVCFAVIGEDCLLAFGKA